MADQWSAEEWSKAERIVASSRTIKEADERLRRELGRTYEAYRSRKKRLAWEIEKDKEIQRLKGELTALKKKYRESLSSSSFLDLLNQNILERVSSWRVEPPPVSAPEAEVKVRHETAVLLLSDLHIGEVVSEEETAGISSYDFDIFRKRLQLLSDKIDLLLFGCLQGYRFDEMVIICLGDMISGNIIDELVETNKPEVTEQVVDGAYVLSQFLLEQASRFPKVRVAGVPGNHGRVKKKRHYKRRYVNWDTVFYRMVEAILKAQPNITFRFPRSLFDVIDINGLKFLYAHGDEIRSYLRFPWYGLERDRTQKQELVRMMEGVDHFDYMVIGHFHTCLQLDTPTGEVMANGSFVGGDEYSIGKLGKACRPTQLMFGVSHDGMVSWRFPIRLDDISGIKELRYKIPEEEEGEKGEF